MFICCSELQVSEGVLKLDMTLPSSGVIREVTASTTGHLKYVTENNNPSSN